MSPPFFLGIDVGTGSARAGLWTADGQMLGCASQPIQMWQPQADFAEQSSEDIWAASCKAVRKTLRQSNVKADQVGGIGIDAACSLVVLDSAGEPVSVSPTGSDEQNVMVWMDHRAMGQAARINETGHPVLRYVGGVISPEMQTPKLLWLKENLPASWKRAAHFMDLPDYLTFRATGDDARSLCPTVCKWTYQGDLGNHGEGWSAEFFHQIGLNDLAAEQFKRIGTHILPMGQPLGNGLTTDAAKELGLKVGTPVGVSIIDAHAGGLGVLGASLGTAKVTSKKLEQRLALIGGTSSCHMAVSAQPRFIKGIWGPYFSAMIPGMWLTEGGQSATGALIDHIIFSHVASTPLQKEAARRKQSVYELLNEHLKNMEAQEKVRHLAELTTELHIQPDFHGNRSPRADATLRGTISGLTLSKTRDDLARQYLAAIQAVAYGTRHILEEMNNAGYDIKVLFACGGGSKNPLFLRQHADITGCKIVLPRESEAVLLGAALLGAVAAGTYPDILTAMNKMNAAGEIIVPAKGAIKKYHDRKYQVFHQMHRDFLTYRKIILG